MSYSRYLVAVNSALRDSVLPELKSARARDAIKTCISTLAAIAANFERPDNELLSSMQADTLPPELDALLRNSMQDTGGTDHLCVPTLSPFDDVAVCTQSIDLAKQGAKWLNANAWAGKPELQAVAKALLNWEQGLRTRAVSYMDAAEDGSDTADDKNAQNILDINPAQLETYLRKRLKSPILKIVDFSFLSGGRSRQTALFSITGTTELPEQLVIQRDHPRTGNSFSVVVQFPLIERLHSAGMKVPLPLLVESSREVLGAPFMIVSRLPGTCPVPSMGYWCVPPKSEQLATELAQQMAMLHSLEVGDLVSILPHSVNPGETLLDDIAKVEDTWNRLTQVPSMAVTGSMSWMKQHVEEISKIETVVHTDMLLHNLLTQGDAVTAVLDWEAAHIGHPGEDIGYVKPVIEQMGVWPQFLSAYYAAGGHRLTQTEIDFFTLLAVSRVMTYGQLSRAAFDSGHSTDATFAEVGASWVPKMVNRLSTQLVAIVNR